jgi:NitT/TauT family transport system substrate-binding protein
VHELDFGYVGLGAHEELVLSIAEALGFYAEEGVRVDVRDATAWDDDRLRSAAIVGLGRTVLLRLRFGVPWTGVCVNTEHPMFWLMARREFTDVQDLRGRRIGMHPALVAPGLFGRIVLRERGLDPDRDVEIVEMHPGDYAEHLRLLASGELDAAVVGSTVSPEQLVAEEGLRLLMFFGDVFRIPTTGVVVDPTFLSLEDNGAVAALVRANVRALRALLDDPAVAVAQIRKLVPRVDESGARNFYDRYVAPYFKREGLADPDVVARAVPAVASELGVLDAIDDGMPADAGAIYRGDLTARWMS